MSESRVFASFAYLTLRSARNRLTRQLKRARSPRYAVALLVGVAYVWAVFARPGGVTLLPQRAFGGSGLQLTALLLATFAARWWIFGGDRTVLAFTPAEVDFLFPAPVTRRELVAWKLLRVQGPILLSALLWVVIARGSGPLSSWLRVPGFWVLFATLHLHHLGAALVRASAGESGKAGVRRNWVAIAVFAAAAAALLVSLLAALPAMRAAPSGTERMALVGEALRRPLAAIPLLPFRLLLAPSFADNAASWARAMVPALALLVAHALWVLRTDAAFEDAAVAASAERARRLAAMRNRTAMPQRAAELPGAEGKPARRARPRRGWPLAPTGDPAVAIVWKNWLTAVRTLRGGVATRLLGGAVIGVVVASPRLGGDLPEFVGTMLLAWAAALVVAGPMWVRNDLRQDLPKLALLKSLPLSGTSMMAAQIAASALALTLLQWLLLVAGALLLATTDSMILGQVRSPLVYVAAVLLLPIVSTVSVTIQNGLALLFPTWGRRGANGPGGIEMIGQSMLTVLGSLLLLLTALAPPAAAALALAYVLHARPGDGALVVVVAAGVATLGAEIGLAVRWLGSVYERTEPSDL